MKGLVDFVSGADKKQIPRCVARPRKDGAGKARACDFTRDDSCEVLRANVIELQSAGGYLRRSERKRILGSREEERFFGHRPASE